SRGSEKHSRRESRPRCGRRRECPEREAKGREAAKSERRKQRRVSRQVDYIGKGDGASRVPLACGNSWLSRSVFLGLGLGPARQFVAAGNEAGAALVGEIRPCPLDHHEQSIAEPDQEKNVDEQPREPGEIAGQLELAELGDGGGAADRGQAAFVVV